MTTENKDDLQNSFFSMVTGQKDVSPADEFAGLTDVLSDSSTDKEHSVKEAICDDALPAEGSLKSAGSLSSNGSPYDGGSDIPHDARRVLVHLMRQGVIIATQKPKLFKLVCRYESFVRRHLSEVYLRLVLDAKSGVVFVASHDNEAASNDLSDNVDDSDDEFATLISRRTLSLYDTLILLVSRKHYQERESTGEQKITIDIERLESCLTPFLPLTDHSSLDRKKLVARVKEMVRRKILSTIRGSEDRYEITPIIRYVVNASFLESMLAEYTRLASGQTEGEKRASDDVNESGIKREVS